MADKNLYKKALLIRETENIFLDLFSQNKLNGTVHTCNGQEFSAIAFCSSLKKKDIIFSNHRCHGHFIARTNDTYSLIAELMGKESGTCAGIGSSQHLCQDGFYSNGIQGGIVPVAAGMAFAEKIKLSQALTVVFVGDGTLGQGVLYESMNLASLYNLPLLIVCENNSYAQSTKLRDNLAGSILDRPKSFGLKTFHSNTWNTDDLFVNALASIDYARNNGPVFHLVDTYRLNHHSKSDDNRDPSEVQKFFEIDPVNVFYKENPAEYKKDIKEIRTLLQKNVNKALKDNELDIDKYIGIASTEAHSKKFRCIDVTTHRVVSRINNFFDAVIKKDKKVIFIGEDVLSPYGGAFKVANGLSEKYPKNVISTPISEAAITGLSNGLALKGFRPYLEIMFGDFVTLSMDQIINHASKFYHMYNRQISCPIVIRTPMGGGRGYGPTHSQTLDKILVGIDNVKVFALNSLFDPKLLYESIYRHENHACIVIENKSDYGNFVGISPPLNFTLEYSIDKYPVVRCQPTERHDITIVTYGGIARIILENISEIFKEIDLIPEIIVLSQISPFDPYYVLESVKISKRVLVVEEGSKSFGIGSEIISSLMERLCDEIILARRLGAVSVPIPSSKSLESNCLPIENIANKIKEVVCQ